MKKYKHLVINGCSYSDWFMFPNNEKNWKNYMRHLDKTYDGNLPNKKQHQELSEIIWEYLNEKFK